MKKLLVIIGITGNQGASVADVFLKETNWKLRGVTRDPSKPDSRKWVDKGVEIVQGDIDNVASLHKAFEGANAIFSVTDFWTPMKDPVIRMKAAGHGQTINEFCHDLEVQRGRNIADAAASVDTLEKYICSSLGPVKNWSKGKYTEVYHFDSKAAVVEYVKQNHPKLDAKMSQLWVGEYMTNWRTSNMRCPHKQEDGSFIMRGPGNGDRGLPMVEARKDTGYFARALIRLEPGKVLLGFGTMISPRDYIELWTRLLGVPNGGYKEISMQEAIDGEPKLIGREVTESYANHLEFGFDGSDPNVIYPEDLGIECPTTSLETYILSEDFSSIL